VFEISVAACRELRLQAEAGFGETPPRAITRARPTKPTAAVELLRST